MSSASAYLPEPGFSAERTHFDHELELAFWIELRVEQPARRQVAAMKFPDTKGMPGRGPRGGTREQSLGNGSKRKRTWCPQPGANTCR
jgi:hypothetical protein